MRSIDKFERCLAGAQKCKRDSYSYSICVLLAPTKGDHELCTRRYKRAIKHGKKYVELANYYGGK